MGLWGSGAAPDPHPGEGSFSLPGTCVPHTSSFCFQVCGQAGRTELLEITQASAVCRSEPPSLPALKSLYTQVRGLEKEWPEAPSGDLRATPPVELVSVLRTAWVPPRVYQEHIGHVLEYP